MAGKDYGPKGCYGPTAYAVLAGFIAAIAWLTAALIW